MQVLKRDEKDGKFKIEYEMQEQADAVNATKVDIVPAVKAPENDGVEWIKHLKHTALTWGTDSKEMKKFVEEKYEYSTFFYNQSFTCFCWTHLFFASKSKSNQHLL